MKIAIIGATGYGGAELVRFLEQHPEVSIHSILATSLHGEKLSNSYPHMETLVEHRLSPADIDQVSSEVDVVFLATPSAVAHQLVLNITKYATKVIDLSGDFRIKDPNTYRKGYGLEAATPELVDKAVYGLTEWLDSDLKKSQLIANPGCYPTAILLGLAPLVKNDLIDEHSLIIDAKTGVSGAGKGLSAANHYSDTNENEKDNRINEHQHNLEINQT